ncbi:hypothetical protein BV22DRAFT_1034222 [Leucogyrophana mollusca]|uniref:Uncharacterized protein n=1 Tax=Leucogyrophana mollusca TaxID=85980 RepID=A0ACB8BI97_9AGAM|nr:hypothetical protein BV22DRAFT_1034222 [Leucogyrophana mollusca]
MSAPLRIARLTSLFLAFVFSVVGLAVGLNALIKSNQEKSNILKLAQTYLPPGSSVSLNVDDHDVFSAGGVITAACALATVLSLVYMVLTFLPFGGKASTLRLQSASLLFCSVLIFATLIPFDIFFATRSAGISATLDGVAVPASLIQQIEALVGVTPQYKKISYLRLVAILPWFASLFAATAAGVLHAAAGRAGASAYGGAPSTVGTESEKNVEEHA